MTRLRSLLMDTVSPPVEEIQADKDSPVCGRCRQRALDGAIMNNGDYFCSTCAVIHRKRTDTGTAYLLELDDDS